MGGEPGLGGGDRFDGTRHAREGDEEGVPLGVDLDAIELIPRLPQEAVMVIEHPAVGAADLVQQLGRAFDIGEHQRHDPARERDDPFRAHARTVKGRRRSAGDQVPSPMVVLGGNWLPLLV
jgi:hypothetical protein